MTTTFSNAPLVEIIAEVRWSDPGAVAAPGVPFGLSMPGTQVNDDFYMHFGALAYANGFKRNERVVPPGFPIPVGQVSHRFLAAIDDEDEFRRSTLWQVGPGVFAANAMPPYKSWTKFRPFVERGVQAMLESRPSVVAKDAFSHISLRYVDAFTNRFTQGVPYESFIREKLGFEFRVPIAFSEKMVTGGQVEPSIQFKMPLADDSFIMCALHPATGSEGEALLMTTTIVYDKATPAELSAVMERFDKARNIIHATFIKMTSQLSDVMQPKE